MGYFLGDNQEMPSSACFCAPNGIALDGLKAPAIVYILLMTHALETPPAPAWFDAVLYPNRPLGRFGFIALMAAVVAVSAAIGAGFVAVGAWPVSGFLGLDVLMLYLAFRFSFRQARLMEFVRLDRDGLTVRRVQPNRQVKQWRFDPYWVQVQIVMSGRQRGGVILRSHGKDLEIGAFLSEPERAELATALREALRAYRTANGTA